MLQNRVNPFGKYIKTTARGEWMGNRGVIHKDKEITRVFKNKAWITCLLEFKGRKRAVMTPNRWTELFFLDEATSFAAGHRPCFECRKADAKRFKDCWIKANPEYHFNSKTSIKFIDEIIHRERIDREHKKITHYGRASELPEGTFIFMHDNSYVLKAGRLHRWTPFGYEDSITVPEDSTLAILTPRSIVNAFRAGYVPQIKTPSGLSKVNEV